MAYYHCPEPGCTVILIHSHCFGCGAVTPESCLYCLECVHDDS